MFEKPNVYIKDIDPTKSSLYIKCDIINYYFILEYSDINILSGEWFTYEKKKQLNDNSNKFNY